VTRVIRRSRGPREIRSDRLGLICAEKFGSTATEPTSDCASGRVEGHTP